MRTLRLPIAEPCHERWDEMDPEAGGRFCGKCTKSVHDLSSMTEDEARALLQAKGNEQMCVRYAHDAAGNLRFRRPAALVIAAVALAACTPHADPEPSDPIAGVPGKRIDLDRLIDIDLFDDDEPVRMGKIEQVRPEPVEPPKPIEVEPPRPEVTNMKMGMIAVPNEPCDPKPAGDTLPTWHEGMR